MITLLSLMWLPLSIVNVYYIYKKLKTSCTGYMKYLVGVTPVIQILLTLNFVIEHNNNDIAKYKKLVIQFLIEYCNTMIQILKY